MNNCRLAWRGIMLMGLALLLFPARAVPDQPRELLQRIGEQEECYLIQTALGQLGYLGAKAEKVSTEAGKFFKVEFGPLYRVQTISVTGIERLPVDELLKEAPKPGDVYSPMLMNSWLAFVEKRYAERGLSIRTVSTLRSYDHVRHLVNEIVEFREGI